MATYTCVCRDPADFYAREIGEDDKPVPGGWAWAFCTSDAGQAMRSAELLNVQRMRVISVKPQPQDEAAAKSESGNSEGKGSNA